MSNSVSFDRPSFMVDSRNRIIGANNSIEDFSLCVELPPGNKFNQVSLSSVLIRKSYYNIVDHNVGYSTVDAPNGYVVFMKDNEFVFTEGTDTIKITIPLAFYNEKNFPIVVKALLEAQSVAWGNNHIYEITYPNPETQADTRKWTFRCLNNTSAMLIVFFFPTVVRQSTSGSCKANDTSRISEIMGFTNETGYGLKVFTLESGTIYSLTSELVVDFELTKYITIKSDISLDQGNSTGDNAILGVIPVNGVPDGGSISYKLNQLEDESKFLANNNKNFYGFSLWDDHDEPMKLNGIDWFAKLFLYEYNPYYELAINDIRIQQLDRK